MRPLNRLISPQLLNRARAIQAMTFSLRAHLGRPLAEHCWVGGHSGPVLTLVTDGGVWATQLRYQQREIYKLLNSEFGLKLNKLRIKIASPRAAPKPPRARPRLSAAGARSLESAAQSITDPGLREALLKLARRGRNRS